jgi:hypothetical protein
MFLALRNETTNERHKVEMVNKALKVRQELKSKGGKEKEEGKEQETEQNVRYKNSINFTLLRCLFFLFFGRGAP